MKVCHDYFSLSRMKRWQQSGFVSVLLILHCIESFSTVSITDTEDEKETVIHILAIVPTQQGESDLELIPKWKRGEEILPAAYLAADEINKDSDLLAGHRLKVKAVRFPICDYNEGIVDFVKELTSKQNNIVAVVGYFCQNVAEQLSLLLRHVKIQVVQISAILSSHAHDSKSDMYVHSIISSSQSFARAAVKFIQRLQWSRIAVLNKQHLNYLDARNVFVQAAMENNIDVALKVETSKFSYKFVKSFLNQLQIDGIKITFAFVTPSEAVKILCRAYHEGFRWPDYAWIFMDSSGIYNLEGASCKPISLFVSTAVNNSVFLHTQLSTLYKKTTLSSGLTYSAYFNAYLERLEEAATELNTTLESNPYANVLYDSVWAFAIALNHSIGILKENNLSLANTTHSKSEIFGIITEQLSQLSLQGTSEFLNFSNGSAALLPSVHLIQFQNSQPLQLGMYDFTLDQLYLNKGILNEIPSDVLNRVYVLYTIPLTVLMLIVIVFCFALTTASMCLFFYYRKHPSIKATSSTLSFCLFIGCYLLLMSSLVHNVISGVSVQSSHEQLRGFVCVFDISSLGVGGDVVLATVIAKTLRIYYIFKKFGKGNRICSDKGLFILILSIVSVKVTLLILWTSIDISVYVDMEDYIKDSIPPYFLVTQLCEARYMPMWLILIYGYSTLLGLIMVLLAILTRKIKRSDFKDSKKITILVASLFMTLCIFSMLWAILRFSGAFILSRVMYSVGTIVMVILCQVFLILPKIVPLALSNFRFLKFRNPFKTLNTVSAFSFNSNLPPRL